MDSDLWLHGTRRLDDAHRRYLLRLVGVVIIAIAGATGGATLYGRAVRSPIQPINHRGLLLVCLLGVVLGTATILFSRASTGTMDRLQTPVVYGLILGAPLLITVAVAFCGPQVAFALAIYLLPPVFAFYLLPKGVAWATTILSVFEFGVVLLIQPGWPIPVGLWVCISVITVSAAAALGSVMARVNEYASREHVARAQLDVLNADLQTRVDDQVEQIARLGQLRRFLSPQIADVLSSADADALLKPHRREIAVLFSDLRSYTRFTVAEAPEDVLSSLDEYYAVVCAVLQRHNATIGSFSGDGVMAFLNDPLPHDDPAGGAVRIALEVRDEMTALVQRWESRGFTLGYGVGIAMGYATLGLLGNEERSDYTAVGPVVNLASRLCAEAQNGQVLIDHRCFSAVKAWADAEPLEPVTLKGFPEAVPMYNVTGTASK